MRPAVVVAAVAVGLCAFVPSAGAAEQVVFTPADDITLTAKQLERVEVAVMSQALAPVEVLVEVAPSGCESGARADKFTFTNERGLIEPAGRRVFQLKGTVPADTPPGVYCATVTARVLAAVGPVAGASRPLRVTVPTAQAPAPGTTVAGLEPDGPAAYETSGVLWAPPRPAGLVAVAAVLLALGLLLTLGLMWSVAGNATRLIVLAGVVVSAAVVGAWLFPTGGVRVTIPTEVPAPAASQSSLIGPNGRFETLTWTGDTFTSSRLDDPGAYKTKVNLTPGATTGVKDITINVRVAALLAAIAIGAGVAIAYFAYRWILRDRNTERLTTGVTRLWEEAAADAAAWRSEHPEPWAEPWSLAGPVADQLDVALERIEGERSAEVTPLLDAVDALLQQARLAQPVAAEVVAALDVARAANLDPQVRAIGAVADLLARPPETSADLKARVALLAPWPDVLRRLPRLRALRQAAAGARDALGTVPDGDERKHATDLVGKLDDALLLAGTGTDPEEVTTAISQAEIYVDELARVLPSSRPVRAALGLRSEIRDGDTPPATVSATTVGPARLGSDILVAVTATSIEGRSPYHWVVGGVSGPVFGGDGSGRAVLLVRAGTAATTVQFADARGTLSEPVTVPVSTAEPAADRARKAAIDDLTVFAVAGIVAVASGLAALYGPTWGSWENWLAALVWGAGIGGGAKAVSALATRAPLA